MADVDFSERFVKKVKRIKKKDLKKRVKLLILKISNTPTLGKPMRYERKGTREVYLGSFRIAYFFQNDKVTFLEIYHKDEQQSATPEKR